MGLGLHARTEEQAGWVQRVFSAPCKALQGIPKDVGVKRDWQNVLQMLAEDSRCLSGSHARGDGFKLSSHAQTLTHWFDVNKIFSL